MSRHPRVVWLLDGAAPTGAAVMAMRRRRVLGDRVESTVLTLDRVRHTPPANSPLRGARRLAGVAAEVRTARADIVVSTSPRTLISASARSTGHARHVHFLSGRAEVDLAEPRVARGMPRVDWLAVPPGTDRPRVARLTGLGIDRVRVARDFVLPEDVLLTTASAPVILVVGAAVGVAASADVVAGFARADPPGWQLRIAGGGPGVRELVDEVDAAGMGDRVLVLGARHDLPELVAAAGLVVRLAGAEAYGLPILEARAAGVPVLTSTSAPAAGLVSHGVDGWVLERTDPTSIAEAFARLTASPLRETLVQGARETAGRFEPAARQAVDELFDDVLAHPPRAARTGTDADAGAA